MGGMERLDMNTSSESARHRALPLAGWLAAQDPDELLRELLHEVIDPELGINIVDLGLVYEVHLAEGVAQVRMTMTTPGCPLGAYLDDAVHACLQGAPGVNDVQVHIVWDPRWNPAMMSDAAKAALGWPQ